MRPANVRVRLLADGTAEVEVAASDMGPGTYTSMTQVAAEFLGLPLEQVRFKLDRSDYPQTLSHGDSWTMASVGSAIRAACLEAQAPVARRAVHATGCRSSHGARLTKAQGPDEGPFPRHHSPNEWKGSSLRPSLRPAQMSGVGGCLITIYCMINSFRMASRDHSEKSEVA
jgi:CO/xanthine dehydrogenase Mo-binding subunit